MKLRRLLCLMAVLTLVWSTALAYSVDDAEGTVVRVYVEWTFAGEQIVDEEEGLIFDIPAQGNGGIASAFAVGKQSEPVQYFVTNKHVVKNCNALHLQFNSATEKTIIVLRTPRSRN